MMKIYSLKMMRLAAPAEWGEARTQEFSKARFRRAVLHFPKVGKAFTLNAYTDNGLQRYVNAEDEREVLDAMRKDFADCEQEEWWREATADDAVDVRAVFGDHSSVVDLRRVITSASIHPMTGEVEYTTTL